MFISQTILALPFLSYAAAYPHSYSRSHSAAQHRDSSPLVEITVDTLLAIDETMQACASNATFASECRDAEFSAPQINQAFTDYQITSRGEQAALLSLMLLESGNFKYERNHFPEPGRPGQGTRNMMNFPFILEYALNLTETRDQAEEITGGNSTEGADTMADDVKNEVLALVLPDNTSFASAAWFYKSQATCAPNVTLATGLSDESLKGWEDYMEFCVGVAPNPTDEGWNARVDLWNKTLIALSASSC